MYNIRVFKKEDLDSLLPLYRNAFGISCIKSDVQNKFFGAYQTIKASCLTVNNNKELVSFYGVICQKAIYNGKEFYIAQSCDSMTHKAHSGKGLFVNLAKKSYETLHEQGIDFVYGFPNQAIYGLRVKKLNWKHTENIHFFKCPVSTLPVAKLVKKIRFLRGFYNFYLKLVLSKSRSKDTFFKNSVLRENVGGVLHDLDYFTYKRGEDKFILNLNGINFWCKFDGRLWVGEFENTSAEKFRDAFVLLKKIAKITGCTSIVFHYHEGSPNDILLKIFFDVKETIPYGYLNLKDSNTPIRFNFSGSDFDTW